MDDAAADDYDSRSLRGPGPEDVNPMAWVVVQDASVALLAQYFSHVMTVRHIQVYS
jgi:hypothetical protein